MVAPRGSVGERRIMKIQNWAFAISGGLSLISTTEAGVIFSQDFASAPNGPVSAYVGSPPNNQQFDTINWTGTGMSGGIVDGALSYSRSGSGSGWFARVTDFSPVPNAIIYSFDLGITGNTTAQPMAAVWQVGYGFGTASGAEPNSLVHSRFGVGFTSTPGSFQLLNMAGGTSANLTGPKAITWVVNNSGAALSYLAPDNNPCLVDNNAWDLWAGDQQVFHNVGATTSGRPLADIKFAYNSGYGTVRMDNFSIRTVPPVPEPAATGVLAAGFLAVIVLGGAIRAKVVAARTSRRCRVKRPN
jgi:hypothetical protein